MPSPRPDSEALINTVRPTGPVSAAENDNEAFDLLLVSATDEFFICFLPSLTVEISSPNRINIPDFRTFARLSVQLNN